MNNPNTEVSTRFFSRDFPSTTEVEWKASLDTYYPMGFISFIEATLDSGDLPSLTRTKRLGQRCVSMSYQYLIHNYYGYRDKEEDLKQAFVLIELAGGNVFAPHIKLDTRSRNDTNTILKRQESKPGIKSFRPLSEVPAFIKDFGDKTGLETEFIGTMSRERVGTFITTDDDRNWSLVADHVRPLDDTATLGLSQVELEYKGRSGVWLEENPLYQQEAVEKLYETGSALVEFTGVLRPTSETKFEWLKNYNENSASR